MRSKISEVLLLLAVVWASCLAAVGALAQARTADQRAAMFDAIRRGDTAHVKQLLHRGISPNVRDKSGVTALGFAILASPASARLLLERGADPNGRMDGSSSGGDMALPGGITPLMLAVQSGRVENVRLLLSYRARADLANEQGQTALHWAVMTNGRWSEDPTRSPSRMVELLLAHGADINAKDREGMTPLMAAANELDSGAARLLLRHRAHVNEQNERGETALMLAVESDVQVHNADGTRLELVKLLLDSGADTGIKDNSHITALERAEVRRGSEVAHLLRTGKVPRPSPRRLPPPSGSLLRRARRVFQPPRTTPSPPLDYAWRTNRAVLYQRLTQRRGDLDRAWYIHDVQTGTNRRVLTATGAAEEEISVSPDGQWALTLFQDADRVSWHALRLSGAEKRGGTVPSKLLRKHLVNMVYGNSWGWMRDSRHWVWLIDAPGEESLHALVFDVQAPDLVRDVSVSTPEEEQRLSSRSPGEFLGCTADGHILSTSGLASVEATDRVELYEFAVDRTPVRARRWSVALPAKARALLRLSPTTDRIAWLTIMEQPGKNHVELWVSRLDGGGMRAVGFLDDAPMFPDFEPSTLRWVPGRNALSFTYKGALYTAPVE